jgi:hypothetical protein
LPLEEYDAKCDDDAKEADLFHAFQEYFQKAILIHLFMFEE